jgi:uncharacterized protein (DUF488 family)
VAVKTIYTVGHSTRSLEELIALLKTHGVRAIADVRQIPKSRRSPHFADTNLAIELPRLGLLYIPFKSLGGRRHARKGSPNTGWRNESFRGYADYMQTETFQRALDDLMDAARKQPTAIMCAEALPWRCHRSLISDALLVRGWQVLDIISEATPKEHKLTDFASVEGTRITYPSPTEQPGLFEIDSR